MENPTRTAAHLERMVERQRALRLISADLLSGPRPVTLEIGCGHGHFLAAYAAAHPNALCLGLDMIAERIARAVRKKNRARADHLHFIHASAEDFLNTLPRGVLLTAVYILFPDPWPKRRHHKNRIMQSNFLEALATFSGPQTRLYFRTDDTNYFSAATAVLRESPWQILEESWPFEFDTVFQQRAPRYQSFVATPKTVASSDS